MDHFAMQVEGNVKACLGFLRNTSCITKSAVLRDVLVESGVAMLASMLNQCAKALVSAPLQFKVCFDSCTSWLAPTFKLYCYVFHLCMQREFKEAGGLRVLADLYVTYSCHRRSMADAWAAFVDASHPRTHQIVDANVTSPEWVTGRLMHCLSESLQTGFSTRDDVQYFFKQSFGRILKDFEVFATAAWSADPVEKHQGMAYLQDTGQTWLLQFTSLICEPVSLQSLLYYSVF